MIVGIDEVGRGSWAGPVCVAAVAWPDHKKVTGLADSKQIPAHKRPKIALAVRKRAASIGIGWVTAPEIDRIGLTMALKIAAEQALAQITVDFETIIIDGNYKFVKDTRAITKIKADGTVPAVMAASVVAKVARDFYMHALHLQLPDYQFVKHVGYGTRLHRSLIARFGPSAQHRLSYAPLQDQTVV